MKKRQPVVRKIAVALCLSFSSHRDILHGFFRRARAFGVWDCQLTDYRVDRTGTELRAILDAGVDGVLATGFDTECVSHALRGWRGPLVGIGAVPGDILAGVARHALVGNDERATGREGGKYLDSLGRFRSFGFVMGTDEYVSRARRDGFLAYFSERGSEVAVFQDDVQDGGRSLPDLAQWLRRLPKPAAVMAAYDILAMRVADASRAANVRIPRDLVLLGCDNDELICETARPPITSIAPDHVALGERAADAMAQLLSAPDSASLRCKSGTNGIVVRQSTRPTAPSAALVERALDYIRRSAVRGAGAADVARHLGVSRRLADLRFREATGESILGAILRVRLAEVKRRLAETDDAIADIAAACGFASLSNAQHLFKARFGCSMRELRRRSR